MPTQDDDFTPYGDRELPWERRRDQPPLARNDDGRSPTGRARRRGGCGGCLSGCGCLVGLLLVGGLLLALGGRTVLPRLGTGALNVLVGGAIDGTITVNNRRVSVPSAWHEPWRATATAYGAAYDDELVPGKHFGETLMQTLGTVMGGGGEIAEGDVRALCERMRDALPADAQAELPPFPGLPVVEAQTPSAPAGTWAPRAALDAAERDRQYEVRRALVTRLSALHGPGTAQQLVPEGAVIYDFVFHKQPYPLLMTDWQITKPPDGHMEPAMQPQTGFSAAPSLYLAAPKGTDTEEVTISFTTVAGTLRFWYWFQGIAAKGSVISVLIDDELLYEDRWPTTRGGQLAQDAWRRVDLEDLGAQPKRVSIRASVTTVPANAYLYIDDLVFAP